mmetsp:Transcript_1629/g.3790  ORF Transcript_1629/g.3790 Transcript_1629/m.3790 type:complete len:431 (+) Transcript_1629:58-1350(+)
METAAAFGCVASTVTALAVARRRAFDERVQLRKAAQDAQALIALAAKSSPTTTPSTTLTTPGKDYHEAPLLSRHNRRLAGIQEVREEEEDEDEDTDGEVDISFESTSIGSVRRAEAQLELEREERVRLSQELENVQSKLEVAEKAVRERDEARSALARERKLREIIEEDSRFAMLDAAELEDARALNSDLKRQLAATSAENRRIKVELNATIEQLKIVEELLENKIESLAPVPVVVPEKPVAAPNPSQTEVLLEAALCREEAALDRVISLEQELAATKAKLAAHDAQATACVESLQDKLFEANEARDALKAELEKLRSTLSASKSPELDRDAGIAELRVRYAVVEQLEKALRASQQNALTNQDKYIDVMDDLERALEHNRELASRLEEALKEGETVDPYESQVQHEEKSMLSTGIDVTSVACMVAGIMLW